MTDLDPGSLRAPLDALARSLLDRRAAPDHWDGRLSNSALSTATAILALEIAVRNGVRDAARLRPIVDGGRTWLLRHQNADGGWGDTVRSRSNISTTAIVWATISAIGGSDATSSVERSTAWLRHAAGDISPAALRTAILKRYGKDRTFSVPILMVLALTGKLGQDATAAWRSIPQLPFELAALPHEWFQHLRLPVVSYALPALIAIGQVRHHFARSRNVGAALLRDRIRRRTHDLLRAMQPRSGGYLEAAPLTSFVVMSLAAMGRTDSPVVEAGVEFLVDSMRGDGGWPIDTNLATWVTTLSIGALADAGSLPGPDSAAMRGWLIDQQSEREHPFTHAAPGAWAWTPLSGGVPDADDTSGALLALTRCGQPDAAAIAAASRGVEWLLGVQNRDGGIPTFCRGWGALPFDRSTPEITAHALQAWDAWYPYLVEQLRQRLSAAAARAADFLVSAQRRDGTWIPLWFGNEDAPDEDNAVWGTGRVLLGLHSDLLKGDARIAECRRRAVKALLEMQDPGGGWGGNRGIRPSIEETAVALSGISRSLADGETASIVARIARAADWLAERVSEPQPSPVGLYFARLWYYEDLYPLVFALAGLAAAANATSNLKPPVTARSA